MGYTFSLHKPLTTQDDYSQQRSERAERNAEKGGTLKYKLSLLTLGS